mgnify:FL=1
MKKLLKYIADFKVALIGIVIFAFGSAAFSIVGPKISGEATTEIFNGLVEKVTGVEGGGINFDRVGQILLFLIGLYVISAIFSFIQGIIMSGITQKICYNLRKDLSEKINRMPMKYFDTKTHGEVLSRFTNDIDTLGQSLNQSMNQQIGRAHV